MSIQSISVPISPGELLDKIAILEIKCEQIRDAAKLANVQTELALLTAARDQAIAPSAELDALASQLKQINQALWQIEDGKRDCERRKEFGKQFIELARSVYFKNDERAAVKRRINELLGSKIVEEKAYQPYTR
jgi:hypothetical protein